MAISEIDSALIEEADAVRPASRISWQKHLSSIAACFVLIIAAFIIFTSLPEGTVVSIYGTELTSKSSSFCAESAPSIARYASDEQSVTVTIPVTVKVSGKTTVKAENGISYLDLLDSTDEVKSTGNNFEITEDTSFIWYIEASESKTEHTLTIIGEDKTETVKVNYDFATGTYTATISE